MPELPEIEALRESIADQYTGRAPKAVRVRQFALVKTFDPPLEAILGQPCAEVGRHGKHFLVGFSGDLTLALHLGIGGRLVPLAAGGARKGGRSTSLEL